MGIFSFFSNKKEEKKTENKVQHELQFEGYRYPTVSASDWEELLEYADKNIPVYVLGGDCSGKKVVLVSKPSDTPTVKLLDDRIYSIVTVDRITVGIIENKILLGTATKEEEKEFLEDWKRRKATAEQEKAEFKKHEDEEGYEPHRFMRSIMSTPKQQPKPAPKQEVKQTQQSKQSQKPTAAKPQKPTQEKKPDWNFKEAYAAYKEEHKGESKEIPVKKPNFDAQIPEKETFVFQLEQQKAALPEFDFYNGDNDNTVTENHPAVQVIRKLQSQADSIMKQAYQAEQDCNWERAAALYEELVIKRYWDPKPYENLLQVYKKSGLRTDTLRKLQGLTINFFQQRREKMTKDLLQLADKYDARIFVDKCINEGRTIAYYDGIFDLYNPYKVVDEMLLNLI